MPERQSSSRRQIPNWLALIIIALLIGAVGWGLWKFVWQTAVPQAEVVKLDPNAAGGRGGRNWAEREARMAERRAEQEREAARRALGSVFRNSAGTIRGTRKEMRLTGWQESGKMNVRVDYLDELRQNWLSQEQWQVFYLASRILDTKAMADYIELTAEQRQKLRSRPIVPILTDAERKQLEDLVAAWDKANTAVGKATAAEKAAAIAAMQAAQEKLLASLAQIGTAHLEETKAAMVARVEAISSTLTPQQIDKAKQWTPRMAPPATRPSATTTIQPARPAPAPSGVTSR